MLVSSGGGGRRWEKEGGEARRNEGGVKMIEDKWEGVRQSKDI